MNEVTYESRPALGKPVAEFSVTAETLAYPGGSLPLAEITAIRAFALPGMYFLAYGPVAPASWRSTISRKDGRKIRLSNLHFVGIGRYEDRTETYAPFIRALIARSKAVSPAIPVYWGMPPALWWSLLAIFGALLLGLVAVIALGTFGLVANGQFSWVALGFMVVLVVIAIGPALYLRALWPLRSRPLRLGDL